jgi:hypothetical protein
MYDMPYAWPPAKQTVWRQVGSYGQLGADGWGGTEGYRRAGGAGFNGGARNAAPAGPVVPLLETLPPRRAQRLTHPEQVNARAKREGGGRIGAPLPSPAPIGPADWRVGDCLPNHATRLGDQHLDDLLGQQMAMFAGAGSHQVVVDDQVLIHVLGPVGECVAMQIVVAGETTAAHEVR